MVDRLSLHEKRLLMRYKLIRSRFYSAPVRVRLSELAELMHCTPRYARTLLRDMQLLGWLDWSPGAGRGAAGVLRCLVDAPALRALLDDNYVVQTGEVSVSAPPVVSNDTEGGRYTVRFYRPLMKITPSLYTVWPERHLIRMVHTGLMRYAPGGEEPVLGLALAADVSADKLTWTFYIRRGLLWHSGEPFKPGQILPALRRRAGGPGLPHVSTVELCGHTLRLKLSTPDVLLLHRLAHPANAFAHPEEETNGLGPFRIDLQSQSALVLHRSPFWYAEWPQAAKISFEVHPCEKIDWSIIAVKLEGQELSDMPLRRMTGEGGFTFLMFNETRTTLTPAQQAVVRGITRRTAADFINIAESVSVLPDWLRPVDNAPEPVPLPPELNVVYCRMPETTALIEKLKKSLLWRGCRLNVTPRIASHWLLSEEDWSAFDFCIGFQPVGSNQAVMFEEHYRNGPMFCAFMGKHRDERNKILLTRAARANLRQHERRVMRVFRTLLKNGVITPLYTQQWCLNMPEQVRGVEVCELGWPDFTSIWHP